MRFLATLATLVLLASSAHAAPITCLPRPAGAGTAALFKSTPKGDFAAWYCAREEFPTLIVCIKPTCGLVGSKRAAATFLSNPSAAGLAEAMRPYTRNPYTDAGLRQVWAPHIDEIRKLAD